MVEIDDKLAIDDSELVFRFARGGGPGGQNVNKLSTKAILYFDLVNTSALDDNQKRLIFERLKTRISKDGMLRVISQKHRTQKANREEALGRFIELIQKALTRQTPRVRTRKSKAAVEKRLEDKKKRSRKKDFRRKAIDFE